MAKIPVKDWSGGINDKFSGNRISENQSKDSTDVELTNFRLSSSKGVDTSNTASGDYKFRGKWETDANAEKFLEYGDTLAKTYEANKVPALVRKRADNDNLTTEVPIGVPQKPASIPTVSIQTAGLTGAQSANAELTIETNFGADGTVADANTGGVANIGSDLNVEQQAYINNIMGNGYSEDNKFYNDSNDRLAVYDGTNVKVYDVSSNQLAQLPTSSPQSYAPTHKDKWWFQPNYWVGVSSTGASVVYFGGGGNPTITHNTHGTQSFTSAVFSESQVASDTSSAWKDGWMDSSNLSSSTMAGLHPSDTWSCTSTSNKLIVSRVRKGNWWTINGLRASDGTLVVGVDNGYSSDSFGAGRMHLVIRDQGSTLTMDGYAEGSTYDWWGTIYTRRYPRYKTLTTGGLIYELYDMHSFPNNGYSYWPFYGAASSGTTRAKAYFEDTQTSTPNIIQGGRAGGVNNAYAGPGSYTYYKCTGNTLIVIPFHDKIDSSVVGFPSNYATAFELSNNGSTVSVKHNLNPGTTHFIYWVKAEGNFSLLDPSYVGWGGEDTLSAFGGGPTYGPGYYKALNDGSQIYQWGAKVFSYANTYPQQTEYYHQFGGVYPIECTEITEYALSGLGKTTHYHNNDATVEPDYYVGSNTARLWNWRQNNRRVYLDQHTANNSGLGTSYYSHTIKDQHPVTSSGTNGYLNLTPEGSIAKTAYDSASKTYYDNDTTDTALLTSYSSGYRASSATTKVAGGLGYAFVATSSTAFWNNPSGTFRYKAVTGDISSSSGWTTVTLGHNFNKWRFCGSSILFYGSDLDVLVPASASLTNKSAYGITSSVYEANLLDSNKIVYRSGNNTGDNVMRVVNTGSNNENAVYALPFFDVIKFSSEFFYGLETGLANGYQRWESYIKAFVFYESELPNSQIKNATSGSNLDAGTISIIYSDAQDQTNRKKYILFDVTASYNWRSQNYYPYISSTRRPRIVANNQSLYTSADCEITNNSTRTITLDTKAQALNVQVGDKFVMSTTAGVEDYTGYVATKTATSKQITLTTDDTVNNANTTAMKFTASRFVSRNRAWFQNADHPSITTDTNVDFSSTSYSTGNEIAFDTLQNVDFLAQSKSASSVNVGGTHFYVDFDKHTTNSGANIGVSTFTIGASNLHVIGGSPYSYKISYLRDLAESNENDANGDPIELLIEGPNTDATDELTTGGATEHIAVTNLGGNPPSDVKYIRVYRSGGNFTTYQHIADIDISSGVPNEYRDLSKNIMSTGFTPLPDRQKPTSDFRFLANVSGIFFSSQKSRLRFSEFGTYHSWPELAYIDMQGDITGIIEYAGEGLVFTDDALYRVRGFDPFEMTSIQVPDVQGLPLNNRKTLTRWGSSVIWLSQDGVCLYSNGQVSVVTVGTIKPETFNMSTPSGEVIDNIYYLMQSPSSGVERKGFSVDFRKGLPPAVSRISQDAERLIKVAPENKLYIKNAVNTSNAGVIGDGSTQSLSFTSREYDLGDLNEEKVIKRMQVVYSGSGTVELYKEDASSAIGTKTLSSSSDRTTAYIYPNVGDIENNDVFGRFFSYKVTGNCVIHEAYLEINPISEYQQKLIFNYADVSYTGSPTISFYVDGAYVTTSPSLSAFTGGTKTVRLWFENAVTGHVLCYVDTSASGEIFDVNIGAEQA